MLRSVGLTFLYNVYILSCARAGQLSRRLYRIGGLHPPGFYSPFFPGSSLYLVSQESRKCSKFQANTCDSAWRQLPCTGTDTTELDTVVFARCMKVVLSFGVFVGRL